MRSIELFVGAGGLGMGVARAGFKHDLVLDNNRYACETIRTNQRLKNRLVKPWHVLNTDARMVDYGEYQDGVDLLAGGPPCQPFSLGGKHAAYDDHRDMFPEVIRALRSIRPRAILIENVKGLTRKAFADYLEYIWLQLRYPDLQRKKSESWWEHRARLERYDTNGRVKNLSYNVAVRVLNAADYGVPQRRERVFFVGFRSDIKASWSFPEGTHGQERLLLDQWDEGEYWDRHKIPKSQRPVLSSRTQSRIDRLVDSRDAASKKPWRTVRDAISDLPRPFRRRGASDIQNHEYVPGARIYPGHTGSPLDEPAKTLKAGDHGVPGGENMVVLPNGEVRYFTVRESARLQTFPDDYYFPGSWTEAMRQLGNAVPVELAQILAGSIRKHLSNGGRS